MTWISEYKDEDEEGQKPGSWDTKKKNHQGDLLVWAIASLMQPPCSHNDRVIRL